jgi:hypothetical protein
MTTFFNPPSAPATTVSVVTGFALCTAAQAGSFDISIGLWCGGVPSSLMFPVIELPEGGAALTLRCEIIATAAIKSMTQQMMTIWFEFLLRI